MAYDVYHEPQTQTIIQHIITEYCVDPEFLWPKQSPGSAIFRNPTTHKWFALIMIVPAEKLGLPQTGNVEIIDLKFDKGQALDFITASNDASIRPAYHMNKQNWFTIVLGHNRLADTDIFYLIDKSYKL